MTWLEAYGLTGLAILVLMLALWAASLVLRDASIVDIFWGAGFVDLRLDVLRPDAAGLRRAQMADLRCW